MNTNEPADAQGNSTPLKYRRSFFLVMCGIVCGCFVAGSIGIWHAWEQYNREQRQPTLDGRGGSESFNLSVGGGETSMEIDFARTAGDGGIAFAFPFGARTCTLMLDVPDPSGHLVSGLDQVYGKRFYDPTNPTHIPNAVLRTGELHRVKILSLRDEIAVTLDDALLFNFKGANNTVSMSPVPPAIKPAQEMVVAIDCKVRVYRAYSRMADVSSPFPKETRIGDVEQILGEGPAEETAEYAMRLMGNRLRLSPASKMIDFQEPFTLEFWYRRSENQKKWLRLTSGCIEIELDNSGNPKLYLGNSGGGNHGTTASTLDTAWHHIAVCNDGYYLMVYLDGQYVCRGNASYFYETSPKFSIGGQLSSGHRSSGFLGDIREIRFSSIARYPMGQAFQAPEVLGADKNTLTRIRFEENRTAIESTVKSAQALGTQTKTVRLLND